MFYIFAAVLLALEIFGIISKPMIVPGLCLIAIGLATGGPSWGFWKKGA